MLKKLRALGLGSALTLALSMALSPSALAQNQVLDAAAKEPGAEVFASGMVYRSLREGKGASPTAMDRVRVHYRGTFPDGREFDGSYGGEPIDFPLRKVIKCWTAGLQKMKVGGKAKLTCPSSVAYGEKGAGDGEIPPNATLLFEIELIAINPIR